MRAERRPRHLIRHVTTTVAVAYDLPANLFDTPIQAMPAGLKAIHHYRIVGVHWRQEQYELRSRISVTLTLQPLAGGEERTIRYGNRARQNSTPGDGTLPLDRLPREVWEFIQADPAWRKP